MWSLSLLCKSTGKRPSEVVGIEDEWAAYQLDQAVMFVGRYIYNKLNELDKNGKPVNDIDDLLGDPISNRPAEGLKRIQGIVVEKR